MRRRLKRVSSFGIAVYIVMFLTTSIILVRDNVTTEKTSRRYYNIAVSGNSYNRMLEEPSTNVTSTFVKKETLDRNDTVKRNHGKIKASFDEQKVELNGELGNFNRQRKAEDGHMVEMTGELGHLDRQKKIEDREMVEVTGELGHVDRGEKIEDRKMVEVSGELGHVDGQKETKEVTKTQGHIERNNSVTLHLPEGEVKKDQIEPGDHLNVQNRNSSRFTHRKWDFRCSTDAEVVAANFPADLQDSSYECIQQAFSDTNISAGGSWFPSQTDGCLNKTCRTQASSSAKRLAIVIPVRDRDRHLRILLHHLIGFLQTQGRSFRIFVVEQASCSAEMAIVIPVRDRDRHLRILLHHWFLADTEQKLQDFVVEQVGEVVFNKASLINAGFLEALKQGDFDCFIFHDVDLLPANLCNAYQCELQPRHLAVAVNTLEYKLLYPTLFGGVVALSTDIMRQINGFSNIFYGWGGEDDESYSRLVTEGFSVQRYPSDVGQYLMLEHDKYAGFPKSERDLSVSHLNARYLQYDGLSSLRYSVRDTALNPLFTRIKVALPSSSPRTILESNAFFTCKQHLFERFIIRDEKVASLRLQLKETRLTAQKAGVILHNIRTAQGAVSSGSCEDTMLYNRKHGILPADFTELELDSQRMGFNVIQATQRPPGGRAKEKRQIKRGENSRKRLKKG